MRGTRDPRDSASARAKGGAADSTIKSVHTALTLLDLVGKARDGVRVKDLSEEAGINKASISKMLATLGAHGYVQRDAATRRYHLGYKLIELGTRLIESIDIRAVARPFLQDLEKAANEVINLVIYRNGDLIYIDKYEGTKTLRMHSKIGGKASWAHTSVGKVIYAFLPPQEQAYVLEAMSFIPRTRKSLPHAADFLAQAEEAGKKGYAMDIEENEEGIICVGAPIFDYSGTVVAGVSISSPTVRAHQARIDELSSLLVLQCRAMSRALGYNG